MTESENYIQCSTLSELTRVVATLVREGIIYTADTVTLRVYTTGGY